MGTTAKKTVDVTWQRIETTLDRAVALSEKNEKALEELHKAVFGVNSEVKGIAKSNGMVAESYFYESLNKSKTFGGIHFDLVEKNMKSARKLSDGARLAGQYDVVMINDTAVCIVEIKYRLRMEDVLEIANKHVHTFKKLFPVYEKYDFYLAVGGMTIEELDNNIIDAAKRLGVGVIKVNGGDLEILDENLKVY